MFRSVHHVFPYDVRHYAKGVEEWWSDQQAIWPIAPTLLGRSAGITRVHVIARGVRRRRIDNLIVHPSALSGPGIVPPSADWSLSLEAFLRRLGPKDVCILHGPDGPSAGLTACALRSAPFIAVYHGMWHADSASWRRHVRGRARRHIVLRPEVRARLESQGIPRDAIIETAPTVASYFFNGGARRRSRGDGHRTVGFVGRLTPEKGADALIPTLVRLQDLPGATVLEVCGPARPAAAAELRNAAAAAGVEVVLLGHVDNRELAQRMLNWSALLLPSRSEGYGRVLLEAVASRVPVAAVDGVVPSQAVDGVRVVVGPRESFPETAYRLLAQCDWSAGRVEALPHEARSTFFEDVATSVAMGAGSELSGRVELGLRSRAERVLMSEAVVRSGARGALLRARRAVATRPAASC